MDLFVRLIPLFLFYGGIILGALALYFYLRNRNQAKKVEKIRQQKSALHINAEPVPQPTRQPASAPVDDFDDFNQLLDAEMPDLGMLLGKPFEIDEPAPRRDKPRVMPTEPQTLKLHTGQLRKGVEVITVLRDHADGRLIVQIGETAYRTLGDSPYVKKQFTTIMKELSSTILTPDDLPVETPSANKPAPEKPAPVAKAPAPEPKVMEQPPAPEPAPVEELAVKKPEPADVLPAEPLSPIISAATRDEIPGDLPSLRLEDHPIEKRKSGIFARQPKIEQAPEINIAEAIENYLQFKLKSSEFAGRNIHILQSISGGVRIQVDQNFYDFVDEVEDVPTREFIQNAIAEWQSRN